MVWSFSLQLENVIYICNDNSGLAAQSSQRSSQLRSIVFTMSVCLCVCQSVRLCVCPANILVFYFSAIRRYIDLKFTQDTYEIVLNSLKNWPSYVKGQGHRDGTLVLKVQSYHKNWAIANFQKKIFVDTSYDTLFDVTINTWASREMTSQQIRQYLTLTCKTPIPKLLFLIKSSTKIFKIW